MKNKAVNRRDFLKGAGSALAGAVLFRFKYLFGFREQPKENNLPVKEARYYTSGDHLAG